MSIKKVAIGGDHAGFEYKSKLIGILSNAGYEVEDFGPYNDNSCDYPDYVHPLAQSIVDNKNERGIIICGSANGVNMVANKYQEIRSAIAWQPELAELTRQHNDANVIAIPARFITFENAEAIVNAFLNTAFEGGRHNNRVNKIAICK